MVEMPLLLDLGILSSSEREYSLLYHILDMPEQGAFALLSPGAHYPVSIRGYALVSASSSPCSIPVYHLSEMLTSITVRAKGFSPPLPGQKNLREILGDS
jgi:hypothetical protein